MKIDKKIVIAIIICILGNFIGSLIMWYISKDIVVNKKGK